jgi:hypothetical protein
LLHGGEERAEFVLRGADGGFAGGARGDIAGGEVLQAEHDQHHQRQDRAMRLRRWCSVPGGNQPE